MSYRAPVADMVFAMRHVAGLDEAVASGHYEDLSDDLVETILEEAGKFAAERLAPLNRSGDVEKLGFEAGIVTTPAGFKQAYADWIAGGWNALAAPAAFGGQGLPILINSACVEMWNAANMAFGLCPLLTMGGIEALVAHGTPELKARYLEKIVSGEWTATMNLTEPQAGSDLAALRTKAVPAGDGSYRITGTKIFITYGEHDMVENICHLVLARLPDAPAGTRGISLFLVPKILPDGSANDLRCHSIEHKLGIHASPTCTMVFGDGGGATGFLIGEENRGLACMFTMMNNARLNVGLQGVAIAERAYQHALAYARERRQGRAANASGPEMSPIIEHPDVKRTLLTMKALTAAARTICYLTAASLDRAHRAADPAEKKAAQERASLLTPLAKAFSSDIGVEVASLGVQVHGGMGFIEETGAAQHLRDARINPIYEGTNGIQAIDLALRKLPLSGGATAANEIAAMRQIVRRIVKDGDTSFGLMAARLRETVESLDRATAFMQKALKSNDGEVALAGATPYLRLFALARGGTALAEIALAAKAAAADGETDPAHPARIALARFFAENLATDAHGLEESVVYGAGFLDDAPLALAS